jgi:hypothetical protein
MRAALMASTDSFVCLDPGPYRTRAAAAAAANAAAAVLLSTLACLRACWLPRPAQF